MLRDHSMGQGEAKVILLSNMLCCPLYAVHVVWLAAFDLHLNSRMRNAKMVLQLFRYCAQHVFSATHALLIDHNVTAAANHT